MEQRASLKLIVDDRGAPASRPRRRVAVATGAAVLALGLAATLLGADRARRPLESREVARQTILQAIELGAGDPTVRDAMLSLRRELGRRPMDAYTRAVYATFILGVSRGADDARTAAFHARRAAEIAPVTVPVIRYATHVLARTDETAGALELVRGMFGYDPESAATLLAEIEPLLPPDAPAGALVEAPEAWLAWWTRLRAQRRDDEAGALLRRALERWPDDLELLRRAAGRAHAEQRWDDLARLLPPDRALPEQAAAAPLFAFRARARAAAGDGAGARRAAAAAVRAGPDDPVVLSLAADALETLGDGETARRHWTRALFLLAGRRSSDERLGIMVRLARLEEREGSPAAALRNWRSILELQPEHAEARRRIEDLTGLRR